MYKITIIDTDTNEVMVNEETDCIIGAVKQLRKENSAIAVAVTHCTSMEIGRTIRMLDEIKRKLLTDSQTQRAYALWKNEECEEDDE